MSKLKIIFLSIIVVFCACLSLAQTTDKQPSTTDIHANPVADCYSCHSEDQPHDDQFGHNCSLCHTTQSWDKFSFDHDLTRFPLIGLHKDVDCTSCHEQAPAMQTTRTCHDCHLDSDAHDQLLGSNCQRCHNPNGWERWQFNHSLQTDFPLQGTHQELQCIVCHKTPVTGDAKPSKACISCHRKDDHHQGDFGSLCERCHQPTTFQDVLMN